ncbi:hypothetical protein C8J55DRAFT_510138 [Lentinula edodes]|uniref:Uncharacterized protein n=1 Tax=Lentinula lateritia TaxID=40482 RepID=A0A9W9AJC6_9AGAR|nr:hypothetical protein C8J55DRAFT_510138 [Lentinula edodes]
MSRLLFNELFNELRTQERGQDDREAQGSIKKPPLCAMQGKEDKIISSHRSDGGDESKRGCRWLR